MSNIQLKFYVEDMSCQGCVKKIEKKLTELTGVNSAKVNFESKEVLVQFEDTNLNQNKIFETIDDLGFSYKL